MLIKRVQILGNLSQHYWSINFKTIIDLDIHKISITEFDSKHLKKNEVVGGKTLYGSSVKYVWVWDSDLACYNFSVVKKMNDYDFNECIIILILKGIPAARFMDA